ncbi:glycosyltransferase [Leptospira mayottensis]|uniref:GtrA-like protein n=2 Tax=Leptospira mayottensis TaxID=1137606 RepID=A0AA87MRB6_9LEPT|nr:glycosyltransferase family 2 protein [Leptospira mayottensis]AXR61824.1 glycosyltransferase family 2 protein [Leptospira mayottensis]AXR64877.1 glycosyltransferase family 2 protein [Leptospira mayottensis]AXR69408.1 glycosyltransferase family 2 protein [Leptospira mayottensis]AZQ01723.1 glycosyltransferase family 2 protein [Leptospira mayottensis 200901116]EKS00853.1 GtrA-like protein [Leptospira mayottensis 200901122]
MPQFSLILPTYNEKENLILLLPKLIALFKSKKIDYEIIIVDDDSPDLTWKWFQNKEKEFPSVRLIRRIHEKGLSSAVLTGMASSQGEYLCVMDADLQHDENILPEMIIKLSFSDIVIGSRRVENGNYGEMSSVRRLISYSATLLAKLLLPLPTTDPMSGFFAMRREVFETTKSKINPRGFKILLEFLGRTKDLKVSEVGYSFRKRNHGETKLSSSVIKQYLIALFELRFGSFVSIEFIKYGITGFSGVFVNLGGQYLYNNVLAINVVEQIQSAISLPSGAIVFGFELSVLTNYFLNNIWTFSDRKNVGFLDNTIGFLKFNVISLLGFLIQFSTWFFLVKYFQIYYPDFLPYWLTYMGNIVGILLATATNYFLNRNFTWKS